MKLCSKCNERPRRKNHAYCAKCGSAYVKKFRATRPKWEGQLISRLKVSRMMKNIKQLITGGQTNAALDILGENILAIERVKNVPEKEKYLIPVSDN